jgi:hypothetical protein
LSCTHGKCYEYYPNGATKSISNWVEGIRDGEAIKYFENGKTKETSMWKDGKLEGEHIEYLDNGYVYEMGQFTEGKQSGLWVKFIEGMPIRTIQYVVAKDHDNYANQWWIYDYFGDVKKEESHYYSIYSEKGDSIKVGESGEIKVKLETPCFGGYMKLVTGEFDRKFNPKDSTQLDTLNCIGFEGTIRFKFDERGFQKIQGIILDGKEEKRHDEKGEYTRTYQREIFFMRTFEVY